MRTATAEESARYGVREGAPVWEPFPAQRPFLASTAYEALYGGAAGGGKTDSLVLGALRHVDNSRYTAIIFRRTFPELEGKVIPVSKEWYPLAGGVYNGSKHIWTFPSGARVIFAHLQHEDDVLTYQGHEFQYVGFDELTHFTERQYTYLLTRLRTTAGIPLAVRSGTNPGGPGHDWVFKRWGPWLDPESKLRAKPGQALRYDNTSDGAVWSDTGRFSRVFFPAYARDNPHLNADYVDNLMGQDRVTRSQLVDGNWLIKPARGLYFQRGWFRWLDVKPEDVDASVRRWDLASTENGGDWTVGVRMVKPAKSPLWVVDDVVRVRMRPEGVKRTVLATAALDGSRTRIVMPQDPGQAGKAQVEDYARDLAGYDVRFERETGDKVTRAQPFSAQCEAGNVGIVRAPWNEAFLQSLEAFPDEGMHDDDVDAAAGAFTAIHEMARHELYLNAWSKR
jgi:predicted phage terminase large subunit-like protein